MCHLLLAHSADKALPELFQLLLAMLRFCAKVRQIMISRNIYDASAPCLRRKEQEKESTRHGTIAIRAQERVVFEKARLSAQLKSQESLVSVCLARNHGRVDLSTFISKSLRL